MTNLELALIAALKQIESECNIERLDDFWKVGMIRKSAENALRELRHLDDEPTLPQLDSMPEGPIEGYDY